MRIKCVLAWALLVLLPLTGFLLWRQTRDCCDRCIPLLEAVLETSEMEPLQQARRLWASKQGLLTTLVTHEEIDSITAAMAQAETALAGGHAEELRAALSEAIAGLRIVRAFDKPSLRSVF